METIHGPMAQLATGDLIYQVTLASGMIMTNPSAFGKDEQTSITPPAVISKGGQTRDDLIKKLHSKKFRDAFVASRVSNTLALQIRVMRQERGWSQAHLAKLLGTSQNAVYRLESPQYGKPSLATLKRLASIFDVGLSVWFSPFSTLVDRAMNLSTDDLLVPTFDDDLRVVHEGPIE